MDELPSGLFKAVVHCRSLINGDRKNVPDTLQSYGVHGHALEHARQMAKAWAQDNKHFSQE
ncbi:MAG: hypothetical protein EOO38_11690 [Cytophagaceae bacterium]|nr:MAG: hypothetical protein EOO38_11690 [Cytophagaceae bacterium]